MLPTRSSPPTNRLLPGLFRSTGPDVPVFRLDQFSLSVSRFFPTTAEYLYPCFTFQKCVLRDPENFHPYNHGPVISRFLEKVVK